MIHFIKIMHIKYLENKISNEKIIERYNLDDTNISLLNEYVSLKLKIAYFNTKFTTGD